MSDDRGFIWQYVHNKMRKECPFGHVMADDLERRDGYNVLRERVLRHGRFVDDGTVGFHSDMCILLRLQRRELS